MFRRCEMVFVVLGLIGAAGEQKAWGGDPYAITDLGSLSGAPDAQSYAFAVNADGQVAGWTNLNDSVSDAFLYGGGVMTDLGSLGGSGSAASGINDSGQVVGCAATSAGTIRAFLYSNGTMTDLGTGDNTYAYAVNDSGQVVGESYDFPFLYSGGTMIDLGTFGNNEGGSARGINSSGQVVGSVFNSANHLHAFLYSGGTMYDLNNLIAPGSGWTLESANAISNTGYIVGYMEDAGGDYDAFRLDPESSPPPVPEPGTLSLVGFGLLGLVGYRRRRTAK